MRGNPCTVEQFTAKYGLSEEDGERLFRISGPSETDLNVLMAAKGIVPVLQDRERNAHRVTSGTYGATG